MASGRHQNNFDLLRIMAALQVAIVHAVLHLGLPESQAWTVLGSVPGVPVFFVISGFLVSESLERSTLRGYFANRALRIFPALWVCLGVSVAIAALYGVPFEARTFWPWIVAQMSVVQFYNPDFLRDFGVGVLNGSLWTIPVELQFYLALPLLSLLIRTRREFIIVIVLCMLESLSVGLFTGWPRKLIDVTLIPWLYLFLIGMGLQRNREFVQRYLSGHLPVWLMAYFLTEVLMDLCGVTITGNAINPLSASVLALLVISAAHARPIPLRHDLSYGLYLYHMPVINAFVAAGLFSYVAAASALAISAGLAALSWMLVERPALRLKRRFH